jgi:predicted Fe-S protein YdhL (DUF1289 family)
MLSPCINVCKLDHGICIGCNRTIEEIANWTRYNNHQRQKIINRVNDTINRTSS